MANKILVKRSKLTETSTNNPPKVPSSDKLEYGELAINYLKNKEHFYIKNDNGDIVKIYVRGDVHSAYFEIDYHIQNESNPHSVTKSQIGLSNVDNTKDNKKPVSTALESLLSTKMDISDIYNSTEPAVTLDLTKLPWSASQGKIIQDTIDLLEGALDLTAISNRISAVESILL